MSLFQIIILSVVVFLGITLLLVSMLLYAKSKLTAGGTVKISINDEQQLEVEPGSSLLATLSQQKLFLPSACGGGGTCGLCRCQVKVREDMDIRIPEEVLGVKKWECEVVSNRNVATFIKEFVVKLPPGETLSFRSGGYIQIDVPKYEMSFSDIELEPKFRAEWDKFRMWDLKMKNTEETYRAYSMANHPAEGNIIMLNIRIATPPWDRAKSAFQNVPPGICSSYIFSRKPGDKVTISGPYGEFHIKDTNREMIYIGGGAGMAPLRSHIFHLFHTMKSGRKVSYWYGARSKQEVFYEDEFRAIEREFPNFKFNLALSEPLAEDNWTGYTGFIHQVLHDAYLGKHETPEDVEYYLCGPPMMNDAVQKMLYNLGVPTEMVAFDDFGG